MISRGEWLAARNAIQLALTKLACIWQRTPSPFPRQWRTCLSAGRRSPSISAGRRCVRSSTAWKSDRQPSGAAIASTPRGSPSSGGRSGRASGANSVADQIGHSTPRSRRAPAPPPRNGHLPPGLVAAVEVESSGIELGCDAGPRDLQPDLAVGLPEDGAFAPTSPLPTARRSRRALIPTARRGRGSTPQGSLQLIRPRSTASEVGWVTPARERCASRRGVDAAPVPGSRPHPRGGACPEVRLNQHLHAPASMSRRASRHATSADRDTARLRRPLR